METTTGGASEDATPASGTSGPAGLRRPPMQRRSAERYERILTVCAELLDEVALAGLTTTALAKRAEVPIGTVYQFFADKSALVHALAARNLHDYLDQLGPHMVP